MVPATVTNSDRWGIQRGLSHPRSILETADDITNVYKDRPKPYLMCKQLSSKSKKST